jgi:hypothetical protein
MAMLRALCLATVSLGVFMGAAAADIPTPPSANAALKYWQAFATLPQLSDAEVQRLNSECLTMPLDGQVLDVVGRADYALRMLRLGAALPRCEWGIGLEEGVYTRLPQVTAAWTLSSLACLRARKGFEEGRSADAVEDVVAAWTLGRHASLEGGFVALLVGYQVEHRMIETVAPYLPALDPATVKDLRSRFATLPPFRSQANALRSDEGRTLDWLVLKVKGTKDRQGLLDLLAWVDAAEGSERDSAAKARAFLDACGGTAEGLIKLADEVRPSYTTLAEKISLPPEQFDKEFEREAVKQARNPVFKAFLSVLPKLRRAQARADVRRTLFDAAIDIRLNGHEALKDHPDPVTGAPCEYAGFPGGFELRSAYTQDGKPLALTVGRRER